MSTMESRKVDEQRQLTESIQKPAEMLEEMKQKWETIMSSQQDTMRELVNQTVTSALHKEHSKKLNASPDEEKGASAAQTKFFEQKIEQFEAEFREKEREIECLKNEKRDMVQDDSTKAKELHEAKMAQDK